MLHLAYISANPVDEGSRRRHWRENVRDIISIYSMNIQIRSYPNSAMALLHTLLAVKPYSRITTSPGADAP